MKLKKLKEFCRLTNLSRKALLIYEKMGLLQPAKKDLETGYRYYSDEQLTEATIIAFLKNFDIPLQKMVDILQGNITFNQYIKYSHTRLNLINNQIKTANSLHAIYLNERNEQFLSTKITQKIYTEMPIVSLEAWARLKDVSLYHSLLSRFIDTQNIQTYGPAFTMYYPDRSDQKYHYKVCWPVPHYLEIIHHDIKYEQLPTYKTAVLRCFGNYELLPLIYERLNTIIQENKWKNTGEYLETYIITGDERYTDSSTFITDVAAVII